MDKKITTHTLETWVEIPILVTYSYQPQELAGKDSPGWDEQINIDKIELQSAAHVVLYMAEKRKAVKTLEELNVYIKGEHTDALLEECWEAHEQEEE